MEINYSLNILLVVVITRSLEEKKYLIFYVNNFGGFYGFYRFCNAGLPSDITVVVDGINFHLHKVFLPIFCCGYSS